MKLLQKLFAAPVKAFCITHVLGLSAAALLGPFNELRCVKCMRAFLLRLRRVCSGP